MLRIHDELKRCVFIRAVPDTWSRPGSSHKRLKHCDIAARISRSLNQHRAAAPLIQVFEGVSGDQLDRIRFTAFLSEPTEQDRPQPIPGLC